MKFPDRVTFAAARRKSQTEIIAILEPVVGKALDNKQAGSQTWWRAIVDAAQPLFDRIVHEDGGDPARAKAEWAHLALDLTHSLTKTGRISEYSHTLIATWVSSNILSYATEAAARQGDEPYLLEWISMHDSKVRHTHKDADGQKVHPGHPFRVGTSSMRRPGDVTAPIGEWINCVVGSTQIAWPGQQAQAATRRTHEGTFVDVTTAGGHVLTVTPNHPVLTTLGYVPAQALRQGDHVLAGRPISPEVDQVPPSAEQCFGALRQTGIQQWVVGGGVNFHGDIPDSEVEIVWANGHLSSPVGTQGGDPFLVSLDKLSSPARVGDLVVPSLADRDVTGGATAPSNMGGSGVGSALLERQPAHADLVGTAATSDGEANFLQPSHDQSPTDAEFAAHLENALSYGMSACEVVKVDLYTATHDVFNFHTSSNWYTANGIAVHNCRCTVAPVPLHDNQAASVDTDPRRTGVPMNDMIGRKTPTLYGQALVAALEAAPESSLIPWHGVLTVEGKWSGDRRKFQTGSLSHRDLPLPLTFQKTSAPGHDQNVTVASIDWLEKQGDEWHGGGSVLPTAEADEMVGLLAHFKKFGVSIDADMAEMSFVEYDGAQGPSDMDEMPGQEFSAARICGACVLNIPAFQEAFVTLGEDPTHDYGDAMAASIDTVTLDGDTEAFVSEKPWDGSASRFTPAQYKSSCVLHTCSGMEKSCHHLPIKEPDGQLSRAGVHAAAGRLNQVDAPAAAKAAAKRALRSAYSTLGEDPPEGIAATLVETPEEIDELNLLMNNYLAGAALGDEVGDLVEFVIDLARGPGWITHPEDTKRIHDYWTVPGQPGYEKIGWGTPGDFNRCRTEIGQEIAESSPEKLRYINAQCAQWHHDALGRWPGEDKGVESLETPEGEMGPAIALVASVDTVYAPSEWLVDPQFKKKTHFTVTEDGHCFGHVADWTTCHMGFNAPGQCVQVSPSTNGYAYFLQGEVLTDKGPVATGPLTLATGHAGGRLGMRPALAHYDNTGTAVADVVCGDDEFGIWVNGWVRPWMSEEKVYELRAHPPSIDLRRNPNTGEYDMIAILSVNTPGLPVVSYGIESGVQMSIIASLGADEESEGDVVADLAEAVAEALERRQAEREEFAALELEDA